MIRLALVLAAALLAFVPRGTEAASSTIDTTLPAQGKSYNAAPIRDNFGAAATDINALGSLNAGTTAPASPNLGKMWLDTSATPFLLKTWSVAGSQWVTIAAFNQTTALWMPPIGGGVIPSIISAATTNLGSTPAAAVYVTGSQSIASFGTVPEGQTKILTFTGAATLVYNSTYMILPGSVNLTTSAGDAMIALSLGAGKWRVTPIGSSTACALFSSTENGCVPASGGGTTNFLRADGSWAALAETLACADLTDSGTACTADTGTSGHTLPFLDGVNTWSGAQTFAAVFGTTRTVVGATDTLSAADCGKTVVYTSGSAVTVTTFASAVTGTKFCGIALLQQGAGAVAIADGAGATHVSAHSCTQTYGQYSTMGVSVQPNSPSEWNIMGDCAP